MRVTEHVSTPLMEDVKLTLKVSQNLHASTMPYVMGAVLGHATEKIDARGFQLEHDFLAKAGLDLSGASQSDGAGGAGVAFYTPDFAVRYPTYIARRALLRNVPERSAHPGQRDGTLVDVQKESPARRPCLPRPGTYGGRDLLNGRRLDHGKGSGRRPPRPRGSILRPSCQHVVREDDGDVSDMAG